jgi:Icc protein
VSGGGADASPTATRAATVTVVQISDVHLAAVASDAADGPDAGLARAVELILPLAPDLVLLTGDIADDGSPAAYRRVRTVTSRLDATILATPGNHDDVVALHAEFGVAADSVFGRWRVVLADTSIPDEISGRVDTDALLARLGPDAGQPTLLALHHPPITTSTHEWFQLDGGAELVGALTRRRDVRIVASGHLHQAFNAVVGGVSYVGCSSSWYSLAHHDAEYWYDGGHVGVVVYRLHEDGRWEWERLPAWPADRSLTARAVTAPR